MRKQQLGWLLIATAVLVLCLGSLVAQGVGEPNAKDRPLRILTYNIHHGTGNLECLPGETTPRDCDFDLARIAEVIRSQEPDLVALQEVDRFWARSAYTDQPELLTDVLGMKGCYGANLTLSPDAESDMPRQYGVLILSRFPILACENTFLPSVQPGDPPVEREQRGLLKVIVNVRGVPLTFYDTHLEHTSTYQDVRAAQVEAIYQLVGNFNGPTILAGDLNAEPDALNWHLCSPCSWIPGCSEEMAERDSPIRQTLPKTLTVGSTMYSSRRMFRF